MTILAMISAAATLAATTAPAPAQAQVQPQAAPPLIHGPPAVAADLLAAERAFEAASVSRGAAAAYAQFMAPDDSIALTGAVPARGAKAISVAMGAMMGLGVLSWTPEEVFASTGDLGAVEGRWTFRAKDGTRLQMGHYVTVWRKDASGAWKGVIDAGVPDS